jgi:hypothetical protein
MSRSLLSQLEQLAGSGTYDDLVAGLNTGSVAEPADSTISGSVEYDLNLLRSHLREIKNLSSDWYAGLPTYAAAVDGSTISGSLINIVTPTHGTGNVLDAKSVLLPIDADNSGAGFAIVATDTGFLYTTSTQYATAADRRGLPIFASTGTYYDEGAGDAVVRIDLLDLSTGNEFNGSNGEVVFGKFHDGADNGGTGDGVDAWVEFYTVSGTYTWAGGDPSDITMVYPQRKIMSEMNEEDWFRTDFVSGFEGDVELIEDIENLWNFTGAGNDITDPTWTNTTAYYLLDANPTDLEAAINDVNDGVGDRDYTVGNYYPLLSDGATVSTSLEELNLAIGDRDYTDSLYLTDGESITASLDALNIQMATISGAALGPEKYVETLSSAITKDTLHGLPYGITYVPNSSDSQPGQNMDVYVDGQLLAADFATLGNNDYAETSASGITPHFTVRNGANITYVVRL